MVEKNGLAQQKTTHHSCQGIQVAIVSEAAVLTEEGEQLSMAPGAGIHTGLAWCENPKLSQLPAQVMTCDPFQHRHFERYVVQPGRTHQWMAVTKGGEWAGRDDWGRPWIRGDGPSEKPGRCKDRERPGRHAPRSCSNRLRECCR